MFFVDYKDKRPIYEQLIKNIKESIITGILVENQQLPSVRQLAVDMAINPNTIQKAYGELEKQQIIYSVKGKGSFVGQSQTNLILDAQKQIFSEFENLIEKAKELKIPLNDIQKIVEKAYLQGGKYD